MDASPPPTGCHHLLAPGMLWTRIEGSNHRIEGSGHRIEGSNHRIEGSNIALRALLDELRRRRCDGYSNMRDYDVSRFVALAEN
jgi:hypothetical protein